MKKEKPRPVKLQTTDKSLNAWKVSKYGVISGPYFPVFGMNTEKYAPEITLYLDTLHAVTVLHSISKIYEI